MTNRSRPTRWRPLATTALLVLAAALPLSAGAAWTACPVQVLKAPPLPPHDADARYSGLPAVPANDIGCLFGLSLVAEPGIELWRCLVDDAGNADPDMGEEPWSHALLVLRDGRHRFAVEDELMAGRFDAWQVLTTDLDGDGSNEHVVAMWNAQGNGLGVNTWTLHVFTADWRLLDTRKEVLDWGTSSLRAAPAPRAGCDIAATSFVEDSSTGTDGIAFEARFLRLQDGKLIEADDQPPLRRRYTFGFQRERTAWFDADVDRLEGDPAGWLREATP